MDENRITTRPGLSGIVGGLVLLVERLERLFSGSVDLQPRRGSLIRAYAREHNIYLVPEIPRESEQCPSSQHTTFMLAQASKRSYCFDCWNAQHEERLKQTSKFHLNLSLREWGYLHNILEITSANLKRILDGQPTEYFESKDFDLFGHLCEGIIEAWCPPEKIFQSPASIPRDADRISVDLDLQEMNLVRMSSVAVGEMLKSSLEPSVVPEFPYEVIPEAEWPASIAAIGSLTNKLTNAILFFIRSRIFLDSPSQEVTGVRSLISSDPKLDSGVR